MQVQKRVLQAATAALYMGPLLAGLAGFGWWMLPPFVSLFVFWLVLTRPHQWPQGNAEWLTLQAWLAALAQVLSQVVLVAILFGVGRGIGGILGFIPVFHPILPLALSFTAIPLMRLVWKGEEALEAGLTVDDVLSTASDAAAADPEDRATLLAAITSAAPLLAAEDITPQSEFRTQLDGLASLPNGWAAIALLGHDLASAPTAQHDTLRRALIAWSTDPNNLAAWQTAGAIRAAFNAACLDCALLEILLPRARFLLQARPSAAPQFPAPAVLDDASLRLDNPETAKALRDLADVLRAARDLSELRPSVTAIPRAAQHGWRDRAIVAHA